MYRGGVKAVSKAANAASVVGLVIGILKDKAKKKLKSMLNAQEISGYRKNARNVGCFPRVIGDCPFCGRLSIFQSMRFGDIVTNKVQSHFLRQSITTYYCMNAGCKRSYYRGYCFRCEENMVEIMGMLPKQAAKKRIFNLN